MRSRCGVGGRLYEKHRAGAPLGHQTAFVGGGDLELDPQSGDPLALPAVRKRGCHYGILDTRASIESRFLFLLKVFFSVLKKHFLSPSLFCSVLYCFLLDSIRS